MISETRFAKSYSSVWRDLTPTLELFIRKANLSLIRNDFNPLTASSDPSRRGLINQIAFKCVELAYNNEPGKLFDLVRNPDHCRTAEKFVTSNNDCVASEMSEISDMAYRMARNLICSENQGIVLTPRFSGCGYINTCHGDALTPKLKLIELKDGERAFRSYEFRQMIVYAALHMNSAKQIMETVEVINSRRGVSITIGFAEFCYEVAGLSSFDLLTEVIRTISDISVYQK